MIWQVGKELYNRINIIALALIILLLIEVQYINDIILLLIDPIKELHNDWYISIINHIVNATFEICDIEKQPEFLTEYMVDYIPSCEITIRSTVSNNIVTMLVIHISILTIVLILWYNIVLYTIPSMFTFEKQKYIYKQLRTVCLFVNSIVLTHTIWTHIINLSLHNYSEFNYYEFDVDFDMYIYICKYIYTIYITFCLLLLINTTKLRKYTKTMIFMMLIFLYVLQIINILELIYYIFIIIIFLEIRQLFYIFYNKRYNLYVT